MKRMEIFQVWEKQIWTTWPCCIHIVLEDIVSNNYLLLLLKVFWLSNSVSPLHFLSFFLSLFVFWFFFISYLSCLYLRLNFFLPSHFPLYGLVLALFICTSEEGVSLHLLFFKYSDYSVQYLVNRRQGQHFYNIMIIYLECKIVLILSLLIHVAPSS